MRTTLVVFVVLVVLAVIALVVTRAVRQRQARRSHLRDQFGPEYARTVADSGSRRKAEAELAERERRHAQLDLHPLDPAAVQRYVTGWRHIQERFVLEPNGAVADADKLLALVLDERGYPTDGKFNDQLAELSVDHATVLDHFRAAHQISRLNDERTATTEQLRQAMLHYRELVGTLLESGMADPGMADPNAPQPGAHPT